MRKLVVAAWVSGLVGLVAAVGCVAGLVTGYTARTVTSDSMTPTYRAGERVIFERVGGSGVGRGDVVLFSAPDRYGFDGSVMQRVVGVGGDRVVCCTAIGTPDERISVNGKPLPEPYLADGVADGMGRPYDVRVPEGRLFLLGDHRANSRDSRFFAEDHGGAVPVGAVQGRMTDDWTGPALLASGALLGLVGALAGVGLGIAAVVVRRRRAAAPSAPWPGLV
ncbi:signal peptidase I [Streptomyces bullii]|uniref:Signal peptidase I n=1 Tax=Streptomyces bullii TaxID=349910 RepID=A0ABW0USP9_9ACTN